MGRRNSFASFVAGYGLGRQMVQDYREEDKRREIKKIADEKPQTSEGFTAEDGDQLRAAAESGQYDVAYDEGKGGYTVTPKSDPSQVGVIAKKGVTDFLGQRTAGTLNDGQVDRARTRAMAGVLKSSGDIAGSMRLEREATQSERDEQRFGWEQGRATREQQTAAREEEWRKGRETLLQQGAYGRVQETNNRLKAEYDAAMQDYQRRAAAGEQGLVEPKQPQLQQYGVGQTLADQLAVAAHDVQFGKGNPEGLARLAKMRDDLEREGYGRTLKLAQSGAPIAKVIELYNQGGADKVKPEDLVSDQVVDRGNGIKSRVLTFRGADGKPVTIDTMAELEALDQADKLVDRVFRANAEARAQGADRRAQETHSTNMQDRTDKRAAGEALYLQRNPNATPAEIAAVRSGVIAPAPGAKDYKLEMNEVATAFGVPATDAQGKPIMDLMTGRQVVNRDTAAEDKFFAWMKSNGITDTNKGLLEYKAMQKGGGSGALTFASEAEAEAAAKAGKIKKGDRITIGGRSGTWQ